MKKQTHILIIDNDEATRRLFGGKLAASGFEVMYSDNGADGREIARRMQPDLILLDIRMPAPDGYETARRLKGERKTADIPIAFFTNEDFTPEAEKMVKDAWVVDYIHKSIDLADFVKRIRKLV